MGRDYNCWLCEARLHVRRWRHVTRMTWHRHLVLVRLTNAHLFDPAWRGCHHCALPYQEWERRPACSGKFTMWRVRYVQQGRSHRLLYEPDTNA